VRGAKHQTVLVTALVTSLLAVPIAACRAGESPTRQPPPAVTARPVLDLPLTVEQAYAAVPHRRTEFDFRHSSLSAEEARYLAAAFHLIDQGVRARVVGAGELVRDGASRHQPAAHLDELRAALESFAPPRGLEGYHASLLLAFDRESAVFAAWQAAGSAYRYRLRLGDSPDVRSASQALHRAYDELMRRFGAREPPANTKAFFDYHCALDFL
jgi:hypothetical protein